MKKTNTYFYFPLAIVTLLFFASCASKLEQAKAEILFDNIATHLDTPSDSTKDSICSAIEKYDISQLDSNYQKAFFFNCYNFILEDYVSTKDSYLDIKDFLSQQRVISGSTYTTKTLIQKLKSYKDDRVLLCLDFATTTSTHTLKMVLHKDINKNLDSLCYAVLNNKNLIRVKRQVKDIYYPEHYNWLLGSKDSIKKAFLRYRKDKKLIEGYALKPYPFSGKLRN